MGTPALQDAAVIWARSASALQHTKKLLGYSVNR